MQYITNARLVILGDIVNAGTVIELTKQEAAAYGDLLTPGSAVEVVPEKEEVVEKPIAEMSHDELKAKAKSLGLKATGSMADLVERISLYKAPEKEEVVEDKDA